MAAGLKAKGAHVVAVVEQTHFSRLARFAAGLWATPAKVRQATGLRMALGWAPLLTGWWPAVAHGKTRVHAVTLTNGRRSRTLDVDYLACGFGLVPNLDLPALLGCATSRGVVTVDETQQTSVPDTYAVGEVTGIGGAR